MPAVDLASENMGQLSGSQCHGHIDAGKLEHRAEGSGTGVFGERRQPGVGQCFLGDPLGFRETFGEPPISMSLGI